MSALAQLIQGWLDGKGWGRNQLAREAGIATSTLSHIMSKDDALPRPETIKKLAAVMQIEPALLTAALGYPIDLPGGQAQQHHLLGRQIAAFPWLASRWEDLLRLSPAEFQELMDYLAFRRHRQGADQSNP